MIRMSSNEEKNTSSVPLAYNKAKREIFITGEITDELCQNFMTTFGEFDRTKGGITIILNTGGGNISAALAMYDLIRMAKNKVTCNCFGRCMSAGLLVLCACDKRFASENCRFMVHPPIAYGIGGNLPFLNTTMAEMNRAKDLYIELVTKHSFLTHREVTALCKEITYMSAEQVEGYGWIDGILKPNRRK